MPIVYGEKVEEEAVIEATKLMAVSARTAPKTRGVDRITTAMVMGEEKEQLALATEKKADRFVDERWKRSFKRDAENVSRSRAVLLVGVKGTIPPKPERPIDCGACGYPNCAAFIRAKKKTGNDFTGPLCVFEVLNLGIALGSAVKTASGLNVDNRIMYTVGAAAKALRLLDADLIIGVPVSATGKNIYFDRK